LVEISENATLYTPEEAQRVGIKIKGAEPVVETCPVCQKSPCTCGDDDEDEDTKTVNKVHHEGTPAQAFQAIADQCHDHGIVALRRLFIRVSGMGTTSANAARSLGLAIPQMGKANLMLEQSMVLEFGGSESFKVNFSGTWDRYKRIKALTDALSQEASNASVSLVLRADFESGLDIGGDQFQTIRDVLESLGTGKISVEGVPAGKEVVDGGPPV
jgi:hypothetical protein